MTRSIQDESLAFWEQQPPDLSSMLLLPNPSLLEEEDLVEVLSYLPPLQGKEVLDLAAGIGRFTTPFAKEAKRVIAVDFCPHFLEKNREKNSPFSNIDYIASDARTLSLPPKSVDLIFVSWLFLYLEDGEVESLLHRLSLCIRPGGHLFFRESCRPKREVKHQEGYVAIYRSIGDYRRLFSRHWKLLSEGNILAYEKHRFDPLKWYWLYQTP